MNEIRSRGLLKNKLHEQAMLVGESDLEKRKEIKRTSGGLEEQEER